MIFPFKKSIASFLTLSTLIFSFALPLPKVFAQGETSDLFSECDDGIDNDGDGAIDYPADSNCSGYYGLEQTVTQSYSEPTSGRSNFVNGNTHVFRTPGTYDVTVPSGMYELNVKAWGAGGGGGSGAKTSNHHVSGFGGGGGGYSEGKVAVTPGDVVSVVVGRGGLFGEGGGNSEASIDGVVIAGAGGGGGGLSVGGPGYKDSGGIWAKIAKIAIIVAAVYFSAGALSSITSSLTSSLGTISSSVSSGVVTGSTIPSTVIGAVGDTYIMSAYTVTASSVSGGALSLGSVTTALTTGAITSAQISNNLAQDISQRDPRRPGGVDGIAGLGFAGIRGGDGAGIGGSWIQSSPSAGSGEEGTTQRYLNIRDFAPHALALITFAHDVEAQSWQPVAGTAGSGYAGYYTLKGSDGGPYSMVGNNPYASSGGTGANGGAGGDRGRRGRDGGGHGGYDGPLAGNAQDGGYPGGGGGGSDTGTGGYGSDGQVYLDFSQGAVTPGATPACRDGIDNDGDGLVDYPIDPGCSNIDDTDESNPPVNGAPNSNPSSPTLSCPSTLAIGATGNFSAQSSDPDGNNLTYIFSWGDGGSTSVSGASGATVSAQKSWSSSGTKTITVNVSDGLGGSSSAQCSTSVSGQLINPSVSIGANPTSISPGQTTLISWSTTDVSSCTASGGWSGSRALSGTETSLPLSSNTTFTLTCTGPSGSAQGSVMVSVGSGPANPQCSDGIDNDGDGLVDFPQDPGCANANDSTENSDSPGCTVDCDPPAQCGDGIDNDGDGLVDLADGGCDGSSDDNESVVGCQGSRCGSGGDGSGGSGGAGSGGGSAGYTVSGGVKAAVQFISNLPATSETVPLSVNPVGGFSNPVTLSVESVRSSGGADLPSDITTTYFFNGRESSSALMTYNSDFGQYVNTNGTIGATFAIRFSKKIPEKYYVTIVGTSGSARTTHVIEIDPNSFNPDFREI